MKAYSVDLRQRVLDALERGMPRTEVIRTFEVSEGSIKRWLVLRRTGMPLAARSPSGRPATFTPSADAVVRRLVETSPDATLPDYTEQWNALHDKPVSQWTLGRAIRRLGLARQNRV